MSAPATPCTLAEAFARQEGFYAEGSRSARNHNPGDIRWGSFARQHGATHGDTGDDRTGMAVFPTDEAGFRAYRELLSVNARLHNGTLVFGYLGATLREVVSRFAPPIENDTEAYLCNVCAWTGLTPSHILTAAML